MKKMSFGWVLALYIGSMLISCSDESIIENRNDEISITELENNQYKVTVDEAKEVAVNFINAFKKVSSTRSRNVDIENVEVIEVEEKVTRSIGLDEGIDTLFYAVNLSNNGGYVLVGADKRIEPIWGISDEGKFSMSIVEENPNFAYFLNLAVGKAVYDIKTNIASITSVNPRLEDYDGVIFANYSLNTKWGQGAPYNMYCPGPYTGCVAVAVSQILSHFPVIGNVSWSDNSSSGSATLHWNQILNDCFKYDGKLTLYDTPQSANEIAHLMRYLGVVLKADYKDTGTSISSKDAINWINDWTSLTATSLKEYNENEVFMGTNAFSNKIVYMRGNRGKKKFIGITIKYTGGHAWVADGSMTVRRKSDSRLVNLFHFNWGWNGNCNGYFLAAVFDSSNPAIADSELPGYSNLLDEGTEGNYQYNVEYSIISNPNSLGGGMIH